MKGMWLARLARPDIFRPLSKLSTRITRWTRNDDKKLFRLFCYLFRTSGYRMQCVVGDTHDGVWLALYVDADFCGDKEDTKSTSGGLLALEGEDTYYPLC